MGILEEARQAPMKGREQVGPTIHTLPPEDRDDVHTAILDPHISDTFVADYLNRHTGSELDAQQIGHYRRSRLKRKQAK